MGWDWISPGGVIYRATYAAYNGDFDDHGDYIGGDYDDQWLNHTIDVDHDEANDAVRRVGWEVWEPFRGLIKTFVASHFCRQVRTKTTPKTLSKHFQNFLLG